MERKTEESSAMGILMNTSISPNLSFSSLMFRMHVLSQLLRTTTISFQQGNIHQVITYQYDDFTIRQIEIDLVFIWGE